MNAVLRVRTGRERTPVRIPWAEAHVEDFRARLLIVLSWVAMVLPQVVQSFTAPQHRLSVEVDGPGLTRIASLSRLALTLVLGVVALWLLVASARRARHLRILPLIAMLAPWVYMVIRDWYITGHPSQAALLVPLVAIALWTLQPRLRCLSTLGYLTALAAGLSIAMAMVDPPSAIFRSIGGDVVSADKEVLPWGLLIGFLTQPNSLGKFLVLGLPAVFLIPRAKWRVAGIALTVFAIVWSASRTSLYAAAAACTIAIVLAVVTSPRARKALGGLAIVLSMGVVCALPLLPTEPTAFTNRSFIWQASLPYWQLDPWFGQGSSWYRDIAQTSGAIAGSAFQGHNQLVQSLVTGGLCYVIVSGLLLWLGAAYSVRQAASGSAFGVVFYVALAGTFALEVSFPTVDNTLMIPAVLVPLGIVLFSRDNHDRPGGRSTGSRMASGVEPARSIPGVPDAPRSIQRESRGDRTGGEIRV